MNAIYDEDLLEVDLAPWSGLTSEEVRSQFPEEYLVWKKAPNQLLLKREDGSDYNPIEELMSQADKFLGKLLAKHSLNTVSYTHLRAHET